MAKKVGTTRSQDRPDNCISNFEEDRPYDVSKHHRAVFSLILSMTGKINFQTSKAVLLQVELSRIPINFNR